MNQISFFDWLVMALYAIGMVAIGWYYSRRTTNTEDYLLGNRRMNPLSVGLSLFASLLSAISYLCNPGEIIRYGPMIMGGLISYPFVYLVVGYFIIPRIMKKKVTSAYEILERRLGLGVRMLGSTLFLCLRLMWMGLILHVTARAVLVPLLGLDPSTGLYVCAVLGLITVLYTSMGGLRAVVLTDVIQTLILVSGAILALTLITVKLGGVSSWWPNQWPNQWPQPEFGFDLSVRMSLVGIALAHFTWWVCTASSDQIAIQRYLATQDPKAARRALATSLWAKVLVWTLLAALGLALLAYFRANPQLVPDGQTVLTGADKLFPQFIVCGLPAGISGLVIAAVLAATMSSLSSGINSCCSVITVDFINRFHDHTGGQTETNHVKTAKSVSLFVGIFAVLLGCCVGVVKGNLLEVTFKVSNLLVAPLAGLFFMALFLRRATAFGAFVGAVVGVAVAVAINYGEEMTGTKGISFVWAMPLSLLAQIVTGMLASLIPIGREPVPLD